MSTNVTKSMLINDLAVLSEQNKILKETLKHIAECSLVKNSKLVNSLKEHCDFSTNEYEILYCYFRSKAMSALLDCEDVKF